MSRRPGAINPDTLVESQYHLAQPRTHCCHLFPIPSATAAARDSIILFPDDICITFMVNARSCACIRPRGQSTRDAVQDCQVFHCLISQCPIRRHYQLLTIFHTVGMVDVQQIIKCRRSCLRCTATMAYYSTILTSQSHMQSPSDGMLASAAPR